MDFGVTFLKSKFLILNDYNDSIVLYTKNHITEKYYLYSIIIDFIPCGFGLDDLEDCDYHISLIHKNYYDEEELMIQIYDLFSGNKCSYGINEIIDAMCNTYEYKVLCDEKHKILLNKESFGLHRIRTLQLSMAYESDNYTGYKSLKDLIEKLKKSKCKQIKYHNECHKKPIAVYDL